MKRMYIGEGTMTGIFSAIYDAWLFDRKEGETGVCIRGEYETELFCESGVSAFLSGAFVCGSETGRSGVSGDADGKNIKKTLPGFGVSWASGGEKSV